MATERDIATLMTDYRRRKNQHSLPSMHREKRSNPFLERKPSRPADPVPQEIEEQRTNSLMKVKYSECYKCAIAVLVEFPYV